ncbi:MAG: hypothetical protein IPM17_16185 [Verrucomicrobia bacterium]|nr:hypothetical protein [Verrucomicrobiota bacterium]
MKRERRAAAAHDWRLRPKKSGRSSKFFVESYSQVVHFTPMKACGLTNSLAAGQVFEPKTTDRG